MSQPDQNTARDVLEQAAMRANDSTPSGESAAVLAQVGVGMAIVELTDAIREAFGTSSGALELVAPGSELSPVAKVMSGYRRPTTVRHTVEYTPGDPV